MDDKECDLRIEVARLQEQVKASDKALSLAERLTAATILAAKAQVSSNWSLMASIVANLIALWAALHVGK